LWGNVSHAGSKSETPRACMIRAADQKLVCKVPRRDRNSYDWTAGHRETDRRTYRQISARYIAHPLDIALNTSIPCNNITAGGSVSTAAPVGDAAVPPLLE
jgi:hypothetical protein